MVVNQAIEETIVLANEKPLCSCGSVIKTPRKLLLGATVGLWFW